jgi:hypothetical protein
VTGIAACYYRNSGRTAVYVGSLTDADETPHIFQSPIYPFGGRLDRDLNLAVPAAALPFGIAKPACYVRSDGVTAIVYRGADKKIYELAGNSELNSLTKLFGASLAASGPVCYVRSDR